MNANNEITGETELLVIQWMDGAKSHFYEAQQHSSDKALGW